MGKLPLVRLGGGGAEGDSGHTMGEVGGAGWAQPVERGLVSVLKIVEASGAAQEVVRSDLCGEEVLCWRMAWGRWWWPGGLQGRRLPQWSGGQVL